jgi:leader peptidase (prepilin peptidase)/N-methyltransferase
VPISPRYPSIELLTAILFALIYLKYPILLDEGHFDFRAVAYAVLAFGLLLGTWVDIDEMWIPDRVSIGGMVVGPVFSFLIPSLHGLEGHVEGLIQSLIGLAVGFGSLWSVALIGKLILKKDAMGFGDVKLMGTLGAFLGWQSIIFIIFMSSLLGTIVGISIIAMGKKEWQSKIPFGPYIALAAIIWFLGGYRLWEAYLSWMRGPAY